MTDTIRKAPPGSKAPPMDHYILLVKEAEKQLKAAQEAYYVAVARALDAAKRSAK